MNPLQVGTKTHPTGQALNVSLAFAENKRLWQGAAKRINDAIESIPVVAREVADDEAPAVRKDEKRTTRLTNHLADSRYIWANKSFELPPELVANELLTLNKSYRYEYLLDADAMARTMATIEQILTNDFLGGSNFWTSRFWLTGYIESAAVDGTSDSFESALRITEGTEAAAPLSMLSVQQQLSSPAYLDRLRLAHGRVFEEMQGLTSEMKSQLRLTLTEGVARGVGVRDLKGMINKRLSVGMVRAERIARTEINQVYRTAYMDEAKDLNSGPLAESAWEIKQIHRSALAPTTRRLHAQRHGKVFTMQQQRDWWAVDGNSINCLCSTLDVLVNKESGEILQKKLYDRMQKQREEFTS